MDKQNKTEKESHMAKQNIHLKINRQSIFIQSILPMSLFNGHTGQTDKQHAYSKDFTKVFL